MACATWGFGLMRHSKKIKRARCTSLDGVSVNLSSALSQQILLSSLALQLWWFARLCFDGSPSRYIVNFDDSRGLYGIIFYGLKVGMQLLQQISSTGCRRSSQREITIFFRLNKQKHKFIAARVQAPQLYFSPLTSGTRCEEMASRKGNLQDIFIVKWAKNCFGKACDRAPQVKRFTSINFCQLCKWD